MNIKQAKLNMIEQQIRPWNVLDERVLAALEALPREAFVSAGQQDMAYADLELPITGTDTKLLAPKIQAKLVQDLGVQAGEDVLELGAATGYMTAILCFLGANVTAYETEATLITQAKNTFASLRDQGLIAGSAQFIQGVAPAHQNNPARFDAILLGGSVAALPSDLLALLKPGGRLIAIVGEAPIMTAILYTANAQQGFTQRSLWETVAARLSGFQSERGFTF